MYDPPKDTWYAWLKDLAGYPHNRDIWLNGDMKVLNNPYYKAPGDAVLHEKSVSLSGTSGYRR